MNGNDRLERELTTWFADTAAPHVPDYTADILGATATTRQRPRWSFPTRWLPAALVPRLSRQTVRPLPWRTIALLALLSLLLAAALILYVGSRPRVPPPFGPAENGLVTYAEEGDIWTVDPVTGVRTVIISGVANDTAPRFSRDGTRVAFLRENIPRNHSLVVTNADGSDVLVSNAQFFDADTDSMAWSPDGRWVAVTAGLMTDRSMSLVDTSTGEVRDLETPGIDVEMYWRPPDGRQLLYVRQVGEGRQLVLVSGLDSDVRTAEIGEPEVELRPGGWTPDGQYFVVHRWLSQGPFTSLLDPETGQEQMLQVALGRVSNDGTRIVGYRYFTEDAFLCVMPLPAGDCIKIAEGDDLLPDWEHTAGLNWSPDDRWIAVYPQDGSGWVLLDPEGGPPVRPGWSERGFDSWQRVAPSGGLLGLW